MKEKEETHDPNTILNKLIKRVKDLKKEKDTYKKLFKIESQISHHRELILTQTKHTLYEFTFKTLKELFKNIEPLEELTKFKGQEELVKKLKG